MIPKELQNHLPGRFVMVPVEVLAEVLPKEAGAQEAALFRDYVALRALAWRGRYRVTPTLPEAAVRRLLGLEARAYRARLAALEGRGWLVASRAGEGGVRFRFPNNALRARESKRHDHDLESLKVKNGGGGVDLIHDLSGDFKNKKTDRHQSLKADHVREESAEAPDARGAELRERVMAICAATDAIWDEPIWEQVAEGIAARIESWTGMNDPRLPDIDDLVGWIAACHHKWTGNPGVSRHSNANIRSPERVVGGNFLRHGKPPRRYRAHPERFLPAVFFARAGLEDPGAPTEPPRSEEGEEDVPQSAQALWQELAGEEDPPGADGIVAMWLRDEALELSLVDPQKANQLYKGLQARVEALPAGRTVRISLLAPLPPSGEGSTAFKATRIWELVGHLR